MYSLTFIDQIIETHGEVSFYEEPAVEGAWYRYEDTHGTGPQVWLRRFRVIRTTPKGVWLDDYGVQRFVLNDARKRWAYPTIELARNSFLIRKRKQIGWLQSQLDHTKAVLAAIEEKFKNG